MEGNPAGHRREDQAPPDRGAGGEVAEDSAHPAAIGAATRTSCHKRQSVLGLGAGGKRAAAEAELAEPHPAATTAAATTAVTPRSDTQVVRSRRDSRGREAVANGQSQMADGKAAVAAILADVGG